MPRPTAPALLTATAACLALGSTTLQAEVLVNYDFTGSTMAPTASGTNVATTDLQPTNIPDDRYSSALDGSSIYAFAGETQTTASDTIYWEFSVAADTGYALDLENLSLLLAATDSNTDNIPFTAKLNLRSSVDGFTSDLLFDQGPTTTASVSVNKTDNPSPTESATFTADLTSALYQDLTNITLRLYPSTDTPTQRIGVIRLDDIVLNGLADAAVPEPATAALVVAALALTTTTRRRRD